MGDALVYKIAFIVCLLLELKPWDSVVMGMECLDPDFHGASDSTI